MAINLTAARPYAKAIFDLALQNHQLPAWQQTLNTLSLIALEGKKMGVLNNPQIKSVQKIELFTKITNLPPVAINLIRLLIARKRLALLVDIATNYQQLFFAYNKILEVKLISAYELTTMQKEQLLQVLQERYQHRVILQCHTDITLIGGAVIYIADKVIDGSIKGLLQRLKQNLLFKK